MKAFWKKKKNLSKKKQPSHKIYPEQKEKNKLSESSPVVKKVEQPEASFVGKKDSEEEPYYSRIKKSE